MPMTLIFERIFWPIVFRVPVLVQELLESELTTHVAIVKTFVVMAWLVTQAGSRVRSCLLPHFVRMLEWLQCLMCARSHLRDERQVARRHLTQSPDERQEARPDPEARCGQLADGGRARAGADGASAAGGGSVWGGASLRRRLATTRPPTRDKRQDLTSRLRLRPACASASRPDGGVGDPREGPRSRHPHSTSWHRQSNSNRRSE